MRTSDIWQAKQNPAYVRTERMYLDKDKSVEELSLDELRMALCGKANGDVLACESCEAKCKFGRRIVELLKPVEMERTEKKIDRTKSVEAMNAKRKQKSIKAYLSAIASGEPLKWFVDNGYEPKNAMVRLRKNYGGVTREEAMAQLKAMGTSLPMYVHTVEKPAVDETPEPTPAPAVKAKLKVSAVDGEYFSYSLYCGQLKMTSGQGTVLVNAGDIAAMCAEIAQAAEMMGVQ